MSPLQTAKSPMPYPLFITGVARSGTTLLARIMSAHPEVMVAADPAFPVFTALHRKIVERHRDLFQAMQRLPLSFQDYYFSSAKLALADIIRAFDLETPVAAPELDRIKKGVPARAAFECQDIAAHLHQLQGNHYKAILDSLLNIIQTARSSADRKWVGLKEVWIIDFLPMLARAYPQARFLIIQRDPRDVLASMYGIARRDPSQEGHCLSYLRHWRKYAALTYEFKQDTDMAGRVLTLTYENLVQYPEDEIRRICRFLKLDFAADMLDPDRHIDYATGRPWQGNSSFNKTGPGISDRSVGVWKRELARPALYMAEYTCEVDMGLYGYQVKHQVPAADFIESALAMSAPGGDKQYSWRSDSENPVEDIAYEVLRRQLLDMETEIADAALVRQAFLSTGMYARLRSRETTHHLTGDVHFANR